MFKKGLWGVLIILIIQLPSSAANWIKIIVPSNNKVVYFDTESVKNQFPIFHYKIKYDKEGYTYIFNMVTNYKNKTSCVSSVTKYKSGKLIESKTEKEIFKSIAPGSLNEAVYKQLSLVAKNSPAKSQKKTTQVVDSVMQQRKYEKEYERYLNEKIKNEFFTEDFLKPRVITGNVVINNDGSVAKVRLCTEPVDKTYLETIVEMEKNDARMIREIENEIFNMKFKSLDTHLTCYIDNLKPFNVGLKITSKNYYIEEYQKSLTDEALPRLYLPEGVNYLNCTVEAKVDRSGKIISIGINNSSGNSQFDGDAITAIRRAASILCRELPSEYEGATANLLINLWKKKDTHEVDSTEWKYLSP